MSRPELVRARITHHRRRPIRHRVRMRGYLWLVDIDAIPRARWWRDFRAEDHFGGQASSIPAAVRTFLAAHDRHIAPGERVLMLANARTAGHVFDPLSTFFGLDAHGRLQWLVLEIHNTYGERHAHLLTPDAAGRAEVAKEFYVSPFFTVDGTYTVTARIDESRVSISIALRQNDIPVFTAGLSGERRPATPARVLAAMLRTPLITHQVSARIRAHGIWLWLRRLPVQTRPAHHPPEGFR